MYRVKPMPMRGEEFEGIAPMEFEGVARHSRKIDADDIESGAVISDGATAGSAKQIQ